MPAKKTAKKSATKRAAKKAPAKRGPRSMSDSHKAALAAGRVSGRAVRAYLEALETHKPKRGRKRTPDSIGQRLERIKGEIPVADPIKRLSLMQEQLDLTAELAALGNTDDLSALEAEFIAHAQHYAQSKGISYSAWRAIGVSPAVLAAAGIARTDR